MFRDRLDAHAARIAGQFDTLFATMDDVDLTRAMAHATGGGKRLRGFLVLESAALYGIGTDRAIWPATAIEALHAYSLVHDDMPCMDDDDLRRGQPTVHVKWDECIAVLAGDALQSLAFECAAHPEAGTPEARADLTLSLAEAAGARGMVLGQALDIAAETAGTPVSLPETEALQAAKTGALIRWAAAAGAVLARADTAPLTAYARDLGLAFQIADDILDVEGSAASVGKAVGKDAAAGKATFVGHLGLDGARRRADELVDSAIAQLAPFGDRAEMLRAAARFVVSRDN